MEGRKDTAFLSSAPRYNVAGRTLPVHIAPPWLLISTAIAARETHLVLLGEEVSQLKLDNMETTTG